MGQSPASPAHSLASVALTGDLARPVRLTVPDLLADDAGPGFDPARRTDRLRFPIAVAGADGHHALLTWAEIDPDFGHAPVLLARRRIAADNAC